MLDIENQVIAEITIEEAIEGGYPEDYVKRCAKDGKVLVGTIPWIEDETI